MCWPSGVPDFGARMRATANAWISHLTRFDKNTITPQLRHWTRVGRPNSWSQLWLVGLLWFVEPVASSPGTIIIPMVISPMASANLKYHYDINGDFANGFRNWFPYEQTIDFPMKNHCFPYEKPLMSIWKTIDFLIAYKEILISIRHIIVFVVKNHWFPYEKPLISLWQSIDFLITNHWCPNGKPLISPWKPLFS